MSDHIKIENKGDYLLINVTEEFGLDLAHKCIDMMVEACAVQQCSKVLLDVRKMPGQILVMDIFQTVEYAEKTRVPSIKTALLGTDEQVRPDKLLDTVAENRGILARTFANINEALHWLQEDKNK